MRRVCTLATFTAVALGIGAGRAGAAHLDTPFGPAARETVAVSVTALSVVPGNGKAEVIISLSGSVAVQDFTIAAPHRIVLDLSGARLSRLGRAYDRQSRGGITNIRMSQYKPDVVRIVLDLDGPRAYTVARNEKDIRVAITATEQFTAWHSSGQGPAVETAALPPAARPAPVPNAPAVAKPPAREPVKAPAPAPVQPPPAAPVQPPAAAPVKPPVSEPARPAVTEPVKAPQPVKDTAVKAPPARAGAGAASIDSALIAVAPPRAPVERPIVDAAPSRPSGQGAQQPRITVTYQNADLRDVIAGFAGFSGRTIVVGKSVTGTVDAEIKDQPWDVALKHILEAQGLAAIEDPSGIIVVDSYQNILEKQASEPLTYQMVKLNYATAPSLVKTVEGLLSKDCPSSPAPATGNQPPGQTFCLIRGSVAADSGTNALLITEVTSRLPGLIENIKQLDVRTPQVALKAKIISVNRTQIEQLGVSYDLGSAAAYFNTLLPRNKPGAESTVDDREGRITLGGDALAGVANAQRKFKNGSALNLLFSTALGKYSLTSFIDALHENDLSDIQAEPSVVTLDNRMARILVGQETPVRVIDAGSVSQIGAPVRANVQFKETGIILTVTPHITNNRQIRMVIEAEQSSLNIVGGDLGFNIDKRNATTQLLVNDGETAVIGGLTQTQVQKNRSGVPILSELPLLGHLFSQTENREVKQDLLILITPHIIDEGAAVRPPGNGSN